MRILIATKFWYLRGGLERVMFDEISWLKDAGHEVAHFSAEHPQNRPSPWSDYFAPYLELGENGSLRASQKLQAAARMFYGREAAKNFTRLVQDFRPDVVHVHGIHRQLSSSILLVTRRLRVPVVQTMHDFHAFCSADVLLRGDGSTCEPPLCDLSNPWPAVSQRCMRGSTALSALAAAECFYRNQVLHDLQLVTRFVSPSRFLADHMRSAGLSSRPIDIIPNALPLQRQARGGPGLVFVGRLSREKGIDVLLNAAELADMPLTIAGEGPLRAYVESHANERVTTLGRVSPARVTELLASAAAALVPSTCLENAPLAVLEAMACGTPVVASSLGGIPELVRDGVEGLLVEPGSATALASALRTIRDDQKKARAMGVAARERIAEKFAPASHLEALLHTYELAVTAAV